MPCCVAGFSAEILFSLPYRRRVCQAKDRWSSIALRKKGASTYTSTDEQPGVVQEAKKKLIYAVGFDCFFAFVYVLQTATVISMDGSILHIIALLCCTRYYAGYYLALRSSGHQDFSAYFGAYLLFRAIDAFAFIQEYNADDEYNEDNVPSFAESLLELRFLQVGPPLASALARLCAVCSLLLYLRSSIKLLLQPSGDQSSH